MGGDAVRVDGAQAGGLNGFWEQAQFTPGGLVVGGWALDEATGAPPVRFEVTWGGVQHDLPVTMLREDVTGVGGPACGISVEVPIPALVAEAEWMRPDLVAVWADGRRMAPLVLTDHAAFEWSKLRFTTRTAFLRDFQHPPTRVGHGLVQAHAAWRALLLARGDAGWWMAAAVVAIYRHLEEGHLTEASVRGVLADWDRHVPAAPEGEALRWALSVHLAAGYQRLAWGEWEAAEASFAAGAGLAGGVAGWPAAVTNLAIASFMAGWLAWRRGDEALALGRLRLVPGMLRAGVAALEPWSWFHFEELRNAVGVAQLCFTLARRMELAGGGLDLPEEARESLGLAGPEWRESVLPRAAGLSLGLVSGVLAGMVARGQVADGPFPARP